MSKLIGIIVDTDGGLSVEATGFRGAECEKATAFLEKALGTTVERRRRNCYHDPVRAARRQELGS